MQRVFAFIIAFFFRLAIWLRYRITIKGLGQLLQSGERKGWYVGKRTKDVDITVRKK